MIKILLLIGWILVLVMALAELVLFFGLLKKYLYSKKLVCLYMMILALGLFYDAAVVGVGRFLGAGTLLMRLSKARFIVRGVLMPLLLPVCSYAMEMKDSGKRIMWILMLICIIVGTVAGVFTKLDVQTVAGVTRYAASDATPLWASMINRYLPLGMIVPVVITGFVMIFKAKTLWMLLAGVALCGFTYLGMFTGHTELMFLAEIAGNMFMTLFFLLYAGKLKKSYL